MDVDKMKQDLAWVVLLALAVFAIQSIAWPLHPVGPDFLSYMRFYVDFWKPEPVYPLLMLRITPVPSLFFGGLLTHVGSVGVEIALALLFAAGLCGVYIMTSRFGRAAAWIAVASICLHLPFCALLHTAGSDSLFALALMIWGGLVCLTPGSAKVRVFAAHGVCVFILFMIRPVGLMWLLMLAWPLCLSGVTWPGRILRATALAGTCVILLGGWCVHNWLRYDDFTVTRGGGAQWPFYRLFVENRLIHPENGPHSQMLADAIQQDLLMKPPYVDEGVTLKEFFAKGSAHYWCDLVPLSDRTWGWGSKYEVLRGAANEALAKESGNFWPGVMQDVWKVLRNPGETPRSIKTGSSEKLHFLGYQWAWASAPDGRFIPFEPLQSIPDDPRFKLPRRDGYQTLTKVLNSLAGHFPSTVFWLGLGIIGLVAGQHWKNPTLLILCIIALFAACSSVICTDSSFRYRLVYDPFFVTFGITGVVALICRVERFLRESS